MRRTIMILSLVTAFAATGASSTAQGATTESTPATVELTQQEFQGLSCLAFGSAAMVGSLAYVELLAAAAVTASAAIVVPIVATAFVAGCGVGQALTPGLLWIYRYARN